MAQLTSVSRGQISVSLVVLGSEYIACLWMAHNQGVGAVMEEPQSHKRTRSFTATLICFSRD